MMSITSPPISFKEFVIKCPMFINVLLPQYLFVPSRYSKLTVDPAVYYAHLAGNRARAHDPSRDRDDESSSGGLSGGMSRLQLDANVTPLKPIHANIQGSMWWM